MSCFKIGATLPNWLWYIWKDHYENNKIKPFPHAVINWKQQ